MYLSCSKAVTSLLKDVNVNGSSFVMGHSRLITNGLADNQPVYRDSVCVIHNGIVVNHEDVWSKLEKRRLQEIDTEVIAAIAADMVDKGCSISQISKQVLTLCDGVVACALALPRLGKLCLFSNNGSLYYGIKGKVHYFASERYPLTLLNCEDIIQVRNDGMILDIPVSKKEPKINEQVQRTTNLIPSLGTHEAEEQMLEYKRYTLRRCSRCILPETMPYIRFDENGVCNYCHHYKPRNRPRPVEELFQLLEPYRRTHGDDCIVPFFWWSR